MVFLTFALKILRLLSFGNEPHSLTLHVNTQMKKLIKHHFIISHETKIHLRVKRMVSQNNICRRKNCKCCRFYKCERRIIKTTLAGKLKVKLQCYFTHPIRLDKPVNVKKISLKLHALLFLMVGRFLKSEPLWRHKKIKNKTTKKFWNWFGIVIGLVNGP